MSSKGWLIAADTILLVVLMVWIQGWWDTLWHYLERNSPTWTAEISLIGISLIAITCLVNVYHIWNSRNSEKEKLPKGILFFALFLTTIAIALNLLVILYKGFLGTTGEPIVSSKLNYHCRIILFSVASVGSVGYVILLVWKPSILSKIGYKVASFFTRGREQHSRKKVDPREKRT